jgi:predicted nuclease of predicted toxin-antitoxin system
VKFLLDESADYGLVQVLRGLGHDATSISHDYAQALSDTDVLAIAQREGRIILTGDRDFGELIFRQQLPHSGVIYLRLGSSPLPVKAALLIHVLTNYSEYLHDFVVVTEKSIRVRQKR